MFNPSLSLLAMITLICISVIIFSIVQLGNFVMAWLGQFENGIGLQVGGLGLMIVLSMAFLTYLIKGARNGPFIKKAATLEKLTSINIQKLAFQFTSGIIEGFINNPDQQNKNNTNP